MKGGGMCDHVWREIYEEAIFGSVSYKIGYRCEVCRKYVEQNKLTPLGLSGTMSDKAELIAPHGATSVTSDGIPYTKQVYDRETGELEVLYECSMDACISCNGV